jgi:ABC-2 type transport system permease protein
VSPLSALVVAKLRAGRHALAAVRHESRLKVAVVAGAAVALWFAFFFGTRTVFRLVDAFGSELLGSRGVSLVELLLPRLLSVFALLLFVMLAASSALLAFSSLYRSREVTHLLTTPLPARDLFLARLTEVTFLSSWSSAYVGSPVVLAYGLERHAPPLFYLIAAAGFVPFVLIASSLGAAASLVAARVLPRLPRGVLPAAFALAGALAFVFFRLKLADPSFRDTVDLGLLVNLAGQAEASFLPSHWLTAAVVSAAAGAGGEAGFFLLVLVANALFAALLAAALAGLLFHRGWAALAGERRRSTRRPPAAGRALGRLPRLLPGPLPQLAAKDVKVFLRDPAQWSQALIFFGVLAVYVATMRSGPRGLPTAFWQNWITLLNTLACLLVLATLTTRFVFPLISLEGRRFWLLGPAPVPVRAIVMQKFVLSTLASAAVTLALALLSGFRLGLAPVPMLATVGTVAAASVALSGLAVGLGSLYPDFGSDDPARIVSGLGGTLTFIASLVYVLLVAAAQTAVLRAHHLASRTTTLAALEPRVVVVAATVVVALTAVATALPLRAGIRHLEHSEF